METPPTFTKQEARLLLSCRDGSVSDDSVEVDVWETVLLEAKRNGSAGNVDVEALIDRFRTISDSEVKATIDAVRKYHKDGSATPKSVGLVKDE